MAKGFDRKRQRQAPKEFDQKLVDLARVTRVVAGGRRFRFRAAVVLGNRRGRVGMGVAKGADVSQAVEKAVNKAQKNLIDISLDGRTITHEVRTKYKGALVLLKPCREGTGIIAGGAVRAVVELAGVKDIVSKMLGSNNKISNIRATLKALQSLETKNEILKRRGK
ncbi:MAG: 30S ribosomal protein S5 [bacterium]|nr:30S ribosomal protein S5 [bacterium]PIU01801.1 MAG: 30S ribosomal protein S5 [bacterium (Candidatus Torokbacteria) CG09_land_8_20_14_0_10_42_11]